MRRKRFAVIGCPRCRRMQVVELTHTRKTCICGYKIDLTKATLLATSDTADKARTTLRSIIASKNSGFVEATYIKSASPSPKNILRKNND
ncbi:MAG TPA: DUF1922 domain-containing protein [Methanocorpusculum sp.]|nr:DUF1922 domain-containing protein [Methanocorpusculum sp.]